MTDTHRRAASGDTIATDDHDVPWSHLLVRVWLPLALASPVLAFPLLAPSITVAALSFALLWVLVAQLAARQYPLRGRARSPVAVPLLVLVGLAAIASYLSDYPVLTIPKFTGLILGALTYFAIVVTATSVSRIRLMAFGYLAVGLVTVILAVLSGPKWKGLGEGKLSDWLYATIPRVIELPTGGAGVNPNALGGTTLFFLPVCMALAWPVRKSGLRDTVALRGWMAADLGSKSERAWYAFAAVTLVVVLVFSQSRTGVVSGVLTALLLASIRSRVVARAASVTALLTALTVAWIGSAQTIAAIEGRFRSVIGVFGADDRSVIWRFGLQAIAEHPWIGVGFGAFREVAPSLVVDGASYTTRLPHAHNMFLQVAIDVGVPGLLAYVAILVAACMMAWRIWRDGSEPRLSSIAMGFWGALFAVHLFGLFDAVALGAKVGLFFWCSVAFIAASYNVVSNTQPGPELYASSENRVEA